MCVYVCVCVCVCVCLYVCLCARAHVCDLDVHAKVLSCARCRLLHIG